MCYLHNARVQRHGDPHHQGKTPVNTMDHFWAKVDKTDTCWLWTSTLNWDGYGQIRMQGKMRIAHRLSYETLVGPIPGGLELDHLCKVRNCVRPDHLEPVTHAENVARGDLKFVSKRRFGRM